MPKLSGVSMLLRLLQSLAGSGASPKHDAEDITDLLLRDLSGNQPSASAEFNALSLGHVAGASITSPTALGLPRLLSSQSSGSMPMLSILSTGLLGGLLGSLFPDTRESRPSPAPFELPRSIAIEAGISPRRAPAAVDYSTDGMPRPLATVGQPAASTVVVNVQAMDSRSFLDHSDDIARAVREALLNSHPLGDYLAE